MVAPEPPSPPGAAPRGPAAAPPRRPSARPGAGGRGRRRGPVDPVDWWMNNEPGGLRDLPLVGKQWEYHGTMVI